MLIKALSVSFSILDHIFEYSHGCSERKCGVESGKPSQGAGAHETLATVSSKPAIEEELEHNLSMNKNCMVVVSFCCFGNQHHFLDSLNISKLMANQSPGENVETFARNKRGKTMNIFVGLQHFQVTDTE